MKAERSGGLMEMKEGEKKWAEGVRKMEKKSSGEKSGKKSTRQGVPVKEWKLWSEMKVEEDRL